MIEFLENNWKLNEKPGLIISVTGGIKPSLKSDRLNRNFCKSLVNAAITTSKIS